MRIRNILYVVVSRMSFAWAENENTRKLSIDGLGGARRLAACDVERSSKI